MFQLDFNSLLVAVQTMFKSFFGYQPWFLYVHFNIDFVHYASATIGIVLLHNVISLDTEAVIVCFKAK